MKAKHECAVEQHAHLIEELRMMHHEEHIWRKRKDALSDKIPKQQFGSDCSIYPLYTELSDL